MPKLLVHLEDGLRRTYDPTTIAHLEAVDGNTVLHRRRGRPLTDVRTLGQLLPAFQRHGFLRIHREHAIHPEAVYEIRRRTRHDWELKLIPPLNTILPIARTRLKTLWRAFGE